MESISPKTCILTITDDHLFYLRVHYAFTQENGTEVMLTSNTTLKGLKGIEQLEPDIILVDGNLPDNDAISVCDNIIQNGYSGDIILFEMNFERARSACEIGVTTCFPRDIGYRELLSSIRLIRQRERALSNVCLNQYNTNCMQNSIVMILSSLDNLYLNHILSNMQKQVNSKNRKISDALFTLILPWLY